MRIARVTRKAIKDKGIREGANTGLRRLVSAALALRLRLFISTHPQLHRERPYSKPRENQSLQNTDTESLYCRYTFPFVHR
ncbi:hypothetical protein SKAU_G00187010 [Synaphobranchus kaupii]|uniref:Uncharacterized protein n=1 Tax=Synaphobranchus kaupii TaxID=118154 RepID=A0A9Q1FCY5_SYNKA|nr:hypothetical protein SKAU_G00187010 [Synaphobranchus kaupii]